MSKLNEIISTMRVPQFDEEMIKKLCEAFNKSHDFYYNVQMENALSDHSTINREQEKEFWETVPPTYKQGESFQHMGAMDDIEYCFARLYINCSKQDIITFSQMFTTACKEQNLPFYYKYSCDKSKRADQIVIYSNIACLEEYIGIFQNIKENSPEIVERCGQPPLLTGIIDDWIGIGEESAENGKSYTSSRTDIIKEILYKYSEINEEGIRENSGKHLREMREEIAKAFQEQGLDINNISFSAKNMEVIKNNESIELFDKTTKEEIKKRKEVQNAQSVKKQERKEEKEHLIRLNILEELGALPQEFGEVLSSSRYSFLSDIEHGESVSLYSGYSFGYLRVEHMDGEKIYTTSKGKQLSLSDFEEIKNKLLPEITSYYKNYFEIESKKLEESIKRYSQLENIEKGQNYEQDIERLDLYSKIEFLAKNEHFFKALGISEEKVEAVSNIASIPVEKKEREQKDLYEQQVNAEKFEIINELKKLGICDADKLKEYYNENISVHYLLTEQELEEVIMNALGVSNSITTSFIKEQILEATKKEGISIGEVTNLLNKELPKEMEKESKDR